MTETDTKATTTRQPRKFNIDYVSMLLFFTFGEGRFPPAFHLPIKTYGKEGSVFNVVVEEDDIKKLCLEENHSLADFEAIRLGIKSFLRDHETYVVNGIKYRVRREDVLTEIVKRVVRGERVPKVEDKESEAA